MLTVKNTQSGPRGVNTVAGPVLIDPGQSVSDLEVYEREREHLEASGWFEIDGKYEPNPTRAGRSASPDDAGKDQRIAELERQLAAARAGSGSETGELKAIHRGRGSFSIMRGDKEVKDGLSKADADAFNAMSDEDKAAFVAG